MGATGAVVAPYFSDPNLLQTMLAALQRGGRSTERLRLEVLKTVGILGVLDPVKLRIYRLKRASDPSSGERRAGLSRLKKAAGGAGEVEGGGGGGGDGLGSAPDRYAVCVCV